MAQAAWRICCTTREIRRPGAAAATSMMLRATRRTTLSKQTTWTTAAASCSTCDALSLHRTGAPQLWADLQPDSTGPACSL